MGDGGAYDAIVTASASDGVFGGVSDGASVTVAPPVEKPRSARRKRNRKEPELLEGDMLIDTPKMLALVYSSLGLNLLYLLQVSGWAGVALCVGGGRGMGAFWCPRPSIFYEGAGRWIFFFEPRYRQSVPHS